jgi:hypothetical protein
VTWQPGRQRIQELLDGGELEQVTVRDHVALKFLDEARLHLATAAAASSTGDLSGAYQLAYDALRKSAASLLALQGLRATSRGGHVAVQEAVVAQFAPTARVFRSFSRIRRARNNFEYPTADTPGPSTDDIADAISVATQARDAAQTIMDSGILTPW